MINLLEHPLLHQSPQPIMPRHHPHRVFVSTFDWFKKSHALQYCLLYACITRLRWLGETRIRSKAYKTRHYGMPQKVKTPTGMDATSSITSMVPWHLSKPSGVPTITATDMLLNSPFFSQLRQDPVYTNLHCQGNLLDCYRGPKFPFPSFSNGLQWIPMAEDAPIDLSLRKRRLQDRELEQTPRYQTGFNRYKNTSNFVCTNVAGHCK